jgi:hypothetical protein
MVSCEAVEAMEQMEFDDRNVNQFSTAREIEHSADTASSSSKLLHPPNGEALRVDRVSRQHGTEKLDLERCAKIYEIITQHAS